MAFWKKLGSFSSLFLVFDRSVLLDPDDKNHIIRDGKVRELDCPRDLVFLPKVEAHPSQWTNPGVLTLEGGLPLLQQQGRAF